MTTISTSQMKAILQVKDTPLVAVIWMSTALCVLLPYLIQISTLCSECGMCALYPEDSTGVIGAAPLGLSDEAFPSRKKNGSSTEEGHIHHATIRADADNHDRNF